MWKRYQKDQKSKKNLNLAIFALIVLIILLFVAKIFSTFNSFQKPLFSQINSTKNYDWDKKTSINLIFSKLNSKNDLSDISVVSLNPNNSKITVLHVSDQIYTDLPKGFGSWKVSSIYQLGQENNPPIGASLLKLSVSKLLGLPIDGLVISQNLDFKNPENLIADFRKNPIFTPFSFMTNIKTDLSLHETLDFIYLSSKVRHDNITALDLSRSTITESKLLPDSSRVLGVNTVKLDTFIREILSESSISEENLSIGLYNATSHVGLASDAARIITNLGGTVTILSNLTDKSVKSGIYVREIEKDELLKSLTYKRLAQAFAPNCLKQACLTTNPEISSSRAQINIVLGEDYYNLWYSK